MRGKEKNDHYDKVFEKLRRNRIQITFADKRREGIKSLEE